MGSVSSKLYTHSKGNKKEKKKKKNLGSRRKRRRRNCRPRRRNKPPLEILIHTLHGKVFLEGYERCRRGRRRKRRWERGVEVGIRVSFILFQQI